MSTPPDDVPAGLIGRRLVRVGHRRRVVRPAPASWQRWLLAASLVVIAAAAVLGGLSYGVEELVWDAAARSYAYRERPGAGAVALAGAALAVALAVVARGVLRRESSRAAAR